MVEVRMAHTDAQAYIHIQVHQAPKCDDWVDASASLLAERQ